MLKTQKKERKLDERMVTFAKALAGVDQSIATPQNIVRVSVEGWAPTMQQTFSDAEKMEYFQHLENTVRIALQIFYWGIVEKIPYPEINLKLRQGLIRTAIFGRKTLYAIIDDGVLGEWDGKFTIEEDPDSIYPRASITLQAPILHNRLPGIIVKITF